MDQLEKTYKVGQHEELHHFLLLKITWDVNLSREHYINELQAQYFPDSCFSAETPTLSSFKDLGPCGASEDPSTGPYSSLIGELLWVSQSTRADVSFSVNRILQFLKNPSSAHWDAALRVLRYLITTKQYKLCLGGNLYTCGYAYSDWEEDFFIGVLIRHTLIVLVPASYPGNCASNQLSLSLLYGIKV